MFFESPPAKINCQPARIIQIKATIKEIIKSSWIPFLTMPATNEFSPPDGIEGRLLFWIVPIEAGLFVVGTMLQSGASGGHIMAKTGEAK